MKNNNPGVSDLAATMLGDLSDLATKIKDVLTSGKAKLNTNRLLEVAGQANKMRASLERTLARLKPDDE